MAAARGDQTLVGDGDQSAEGGRVLLTTHLDGGPAAFGTLFTRHRDRFACPGGDTPAATVTVGDR